MGNGRDFVSLSFRLTGLAPNTLYHYRVVASNSKGTAYGENETFLTGIQPPTPMKKIAFFDFSLSADAAGVYVMNEDGSGVKQIAPAGSPDMTTLYQGWFHWAPDGRKILYTDSFSSQTLTPDIYVVNEDGTGWKNLTNTPEEAEFQAYSNGPVWSPDGAKIVYTNRTAFPKRRIYIFVMDADGSNRKCLTCDMVDGIIDTEPSFSHDGKKITFTHNRDLWIMDADGSNKKELYHPTSTTEEGFRSIVIVPTFTLDGTRILFEETDEWSTIYSIEVETGRLERLTPPNTYGGHPFLSPDGQKIAFVNTGEWNIYVMNVDGSNLRRITTKDRHRIWGWLSWCSDSRKIVFFDDSRYISIVDIENPFIQRLRHAYVAFPTPACN